MVEIRRRCVEVGDVTLQLTEAGRPGDPLVLLCHGFPECAHSWRHQMAPLADAGYHVIAPDQRGYAHSTAPRRVEAYGIHQLTGDLVGLIDDAGAEQAVVVGHDWGAWVAWEMGRIHPDRTRAIVAISVPFTQFPTKPTELMRAMWGDRFFYILYFQQVGPPEAELEADVRETMRSIMWAASGSQYRGLPSELPPMEGTGFLDMMGDVPDGLPTWLSEHDLQVYVDAFTTSGFFGPLSWYRNLDANHAAVEGLGPDRLTMPSCFIGGTRDPVIAGRPEYVDAMSSLLPGYRGTTMIDGAGHWTQQEALDETNAALLAFVASLG
jgi:pimeloyl-ACP methyl ester carboxylesterase